MYIYKIEDLNGRVRFIGTTESMVYLDNLSRNNVELTIKKWLDCNVYNLSYVRIEDPDSRNTFTKILEYIYIDDLLGKKYDKIRYLMVLIAVNPNITNIECASTMGVSLDSVKRILSSLKNDGIIEIQIKTVKRGNDYFPLRTVNTCNIKKLNLSPKLSIPKEEILKKLSLIHWEPVPK